MSQLTRPALCFSLPLLLLLVAGALALPGNGRAAGEKRAQPIYDAAWQGMGVRIGLGRRRASPFPRGAFFARSRQAPRTPCT